MAHRAATYGFLNQGLTEIISSTLASSGHSHAPKPPGSPIKVFKYLLKLSFFSHDAIAVQIVPNEVLCVPL